MSRFQESLWKFRDIRDVSERDVTKETGVESEWCWRRGVGEGVPEKHQGSCPSVRGRSVETRTSRVTDPTRRRSITVPE